MAGRPIRRDAPVNRGAPLPMRHNNPVVVNARPIRGDISFKVKSDVQD